MDILSYAVPWEVTRNTFLHGEINRFRAIVYKGPDSPIPPSHDGTPFVEPHPPLTFAAITQR